ncbi:MAG: periplasmic heavy metal sensor [Candidatus Eisenbacteria bacterium]|nr:periplasmic heavy metal sensor [Candidatus Eisenbacteria bacterium]
MKRHWLSLAVVILIILNLSALGTLVYHRWFTPPKHRLPHHPERMVDFLRKELSLTDTQVAESESLRVRSEASMSGVQRELEQKRQSLMKELAADAPDSTRANQLVEEIAMLQMTLEKQVIRHMLQQNAILTSEQRAKLFSLLQERMHRRDAMFGPSMGGPEGGPQLGGPGGRPPEGPREGSREERGHGG